jgi:transcriptional regulator with XRE-family HTH domain
MRHNLTLRRQGTITSEVIGGSRVAEDDRAMTVGPMVQHWRKSRHLSQLDLAIRAEISARHLCFVETGKSNPSREMVLKLADVLDVPLRERNEMLLAAGFAPMYSESKLDAPALAVVQRAVDAIMKQQEPFPAVVMNRHWDVTHRNEAARRFFSYLLGKPATGPANVLRMMFHPDGLRPHVRNWPEVASSLMERARREVVGGVADAQLSALLNEVSGYRGVAAVLKEARHASPLPIHPIVFEKGDRRYDFFSTVTTLGTAQDVTVQEIRIECFFPASDATAKLAKSTLNRDHS